MECSVVVPLANVLAPRAILVLVGRDAQLVTQESTSLHAGQSRGHGVTPLRDEDNEGQGLRGLIQQLLTDTDRNMLTRIYRPEQSALDPEGPV